MPHLNNQTNHREQKMLEGQHKPLDLAKRVLDNEAISSVRDCAQLHLRGWKILDRWAFNSPEKLTALVKSGEVLFLGRLLEQQELEHNVLLDATEILNTGTPEQEVLEMNHIQTELL